MRKTKVKRASSPNPAVFQRGVGRVEPKALKRSPSTNASKRFDEDTIIWGENDSFPLEVIKSVEESPTTSSCLQKRAEFIKGAGFTDKSLERLVINEKGETLWDIHCQFAEIMSVLEGFSVLHKYNIEGGITEAYYIGFESLRFVKPIEDTDDNILYVKYNPFWGTQEFNKKFTKSYPLYDPELLSGQMEEMKDEFSGQVYYFGTTSPIYRFYPRPKYWSGSRWIKADGKIQMFHDENLENGFFQSTLINVIGNPSDWSTNPEYQKTEIGTDGQQRTVSTKTIGEEFNEMMGENFSGARKAGTAMVLWSQNKESAAQIQNFPTNTNADLLQGTFTDIIRGITISTGVPGVLANLPQDGLFQSSGESFQKAIEIMQSSTLWFRKQLENYYNNVLLPGMGVQQRVEIKQYQPASIPVEIDDKVWEFLNDQEKQVFIKKNFNIELFRAPVQMQPEQPTQPVQPEVAKANEALKNLNIADLNRIQKIVSRYNLYKNDPNNPKGLTYDQAKQMLTSYGFNEEELNAWLVTPEEDDA